MRVGLSSVEQVRVLFLSKREGVSAWPAKPFSSQSQPLFGSSLCSGPAERERGPARGEGRSRAGVAQGAAGAHLPLNTLSPILLLVLTGHTTLMFVRCAVHADTEGSALDRKVGIFYMELKYWTHWHIPSIGAERCTRDKEVMFFFFLFVKSRVVVVVLRVMRHSFILWISFQTVNHSVIIGRERGKWESLVQFFCTNENNLCQGGSLLITSNHMHPMWVLTENVSFFLSG